MSRFIPRIRIVKQMIELTELQHLPRYQRCPADGGVAHYCRRPLAFPPSSLQLLLESDRRGGRVVALKAVWIRLSAAELHSGIISSKTTGEHLLWTARFCSETQHRALHHILDHKSPKPQR